MTFPTMWPWQDIKGGMGAGQSEKVEMRKAIQGATVVVVFFSFKYLRSDNCIREIAHTLLWQKHIVPVLLPDWGTDRPPSEREVDLPLQESLDFNGEAWWKYAKIYGKILEPDTKYPVAWEQLQRFKPIVLGGSVDMAVDEALPEQIRREIIDRVFQRFHRSSPAGLETEAAIVRLRKTLLHDLRLELTKLASDSDAVFAQLDTDGSGDISFEELREWGAARGWRFTDANLRRLYCEFPHSARGCLDRAAFQEYCLSFLPAPASKPPPDARGGTRGSFRGSWRARTPPAEPQLPESASAGTEISGNTVADNVTTGSHAQQSARGSAEDAGVAAKNAALKLEQTETECVNEETAREIGVADSELAKSAELQATKSDLRSESERQRAMQAKSGCCVVQ